MSTLEELRGRIFEANSQGYPTRHPLHFLRVLRQYLPQGRYMLKKFGWKSCYTFWYAKLFISDEGGEYDLLDPLIRRFPGLLRSPSKIEVEHTMLCDKKCVFCSHTHWQEQKEQMSFERFRRIIDDLPGLKWLNMAGIGSNFLNRDFMKMLRYARRKNINVNFVDEFEYFGEEHSKEVIELGINSIYVSFDAATKATYEAIKKGCDYDKSVKNIRRLLELKNSMDSPFPVLHFRFIITRLNYHEMPAYLEFINGLGPRRGVRARVEFIGLITFGGVERYYMPLEEIPRELIERTYENSLKYGINLHFSHARAALPPMHTCVRWAEPFILASGDVVSCCSILMQSRRDFLKKNSFGNVFEKSFGEIWNSKKYRDFRRLVLSPDGAVPESCSACCSFSVSERARRCGIAPAARL